MGKISFNVLAIIILLILCFGVVSASFYLYEKPKVKETIITKDYPSGYQKITKTYYYPEEQEYRKVIKTYYPETAYYKYQPAYKVYYPSHTRIIYQDYDDCLSCNRKTYFDRSDYYYYEYSPYMKTLELKECYNYPPEGKLFYRKCP